MKSLCSFADRSFFTVSYALQWLVNGKFIKASPCGDFPRQPCHIREKLLDSRDGRSIVIIIYCIIFVHKMYALFKCLEY